MDDDLNCAGERESNAHEMPAYGLLRAAARLVERAVLKLNMAEAPCPHCGTRLFADIDHARVYEQLSGYKEKLENAADKVEASLVVGARASRGFTAARERYLAGETWLS